MTGEAASRETQTPCKHASSSSQSIERVHGAFGPPAKVVDPHPGSRNAASAIGARTNSKAL